MVDISLTCRQCGREFVFAEGEQDFYKSKGFSTPGRCRACRLSRQARSQSTTACSQCGTELDKDASVFCTACLASVHLDIHLKTEQLRQAASEAQFRLTAAEYQSAKLTESLHQKELRLADLETQVRSLGHDLEQANERESRITEADSRKAALLKQQSQLAASLEEKIDGLNQELEKTRRFHADLQWLHPVMDGIQDRLKVLEMKQNETHHRMVQVVEKAYRGDGQPGVLHLLRRSLANIFTGRSAQK